MVDIISGLLNLKTRWRLACWQQIARRIETLEADIRQLSDDRLRKASLALRFRIQSGEKPKDILPEAYALAREAAVRSLGMRHYDVQLIGGMAMYFNSVSEMQTGEGKTLTATLPLYLAALSGKGAHLATANDYLAKRDAELMEPLFQLLGLSIGVIQAQMPNDKRRSAYAQDITYGTVKEFGFDFLRDRLLKNHIQQTGSHKCRPVSELVQRDLHFILVDEADSILIDEARTPLVISAAPDEAAKAQSEAYYWAASIAAQFQFKQHYDCDLVSRKVNLSSEGRRKCRQLSTDRAARSLSALKQYEFVERAIKVQRDMIRDRQYVVRDNEVVIVDEFTGRLAEGRNWQGGLHQAVEAKEGLEITIEAGPAARITVQDLFSLYRSRAGMSGTAIGSAREFLKIYKLQVVPIPTHRPPIRKELSARVFGTHQQKWQAIADEAAELHATGRPILIGTRSIDRSIAVSDELMKRGIAHQVLNANHSHDEATIVAAAGGLGQVTVATNMAGRGTDIKLGEGVEEIGGLHVICSEMHESARIDRQLTGRCGRQGDPGSFRQYVSLEDELLEQGNASKHLKRSRARGHGQRSSLRAFRRAQSKLERSRYSDRKVLMLQEKNRRKMLIEMGQDPYLEGLG